MSVMLTPTHLSTPSAAGCRQPTRQTTLNSRRTCARSGGFPFRASCVDERFMDLIQDGVVSDVDSRNKAIPSHGNEAGDVAALPGVVMDDANLHPAP